MGPGEEIDLPVGLVGLDVDVTPGLAHQIHGDGFLLRIVDGDKVRVSRTQHLAAGIADAAGAVCACFA